MLVALCSDKGSPGVTTAALALASAWSEQSIVVEADPYGGDLSARLHPQRGETLAPTPTVLTVATAARTAGDPYVVARNAQVLTDQVLVVPGFMVAEQGARVNDWAPAAAAMRASVYPVFADLGRIHADSPVMPIAAAADVVCLVLRPTLETAVRVQERANRLMAALSAARAERPRIVGLVVTLPRFAAGDAADIEELLRDSAAGPFLAGVTHLNMDPDGVERLERGERAGPVSERRAGRGRGRRGHSRLARSADAVAHQLRLLLGTDLAASSAEPPSLESPPRMPETASEQGSRRRLHRAVAVEDPVVESRPPTGAQERS